MTRVRRARNRRIGFIAPTTGQARARTARRERFIAMLRRPVAMLSAGALVTTMLVAVGLTTGSAPASADAFTPAVSVTNAQSEKPFILAGEDASYDITVSNPGGSGDKFNLSVTALLPTGIEFREATFLGTPTVHGPLEVLPNGTRTAGPMPATDCAPLEPVGPTSRACRVPAGQQLWVWQNVSDLPAGGTIRSTLTVRPDATVYPVGTADLGFELRGYTSTTPTLLPTFDGSTSVSPTGAHTSQPGIDDVSTDVRSLRVFKSEPSPEQELLRGVHEHTTTYTIVVENSGQGPTDSIIVTDYLHAGLEYLGIGGVDNTAPSTALYDGDREYPTAAPLTATPAPAGGPGDWSGVDEDVETVLLDAAAAAALGLPGAGVYTKVTWTIGTRAGGTPQALDLSAPATPDRYTIRYRAAVPLFENTMDWENPGATAPATTGEQAANLNNNNGPSTRHGLDPASHDDARGLPNTVIATGTYQGQVTNPATDRAVEDDDVVTISAVDLRVGKSVTPTVLNVGQLATYRLEIATSEYTSASSIVLHDDMANGLCPALPPGSAGGGEPTFRLDGVVVDKTDWDLAVGAECAQPSSVPGSQVTNADVDHIDFITASGRFHIGLVPADMTEDEELVITYTAFQRTVYYPANRDGVPSSGDALENTVAIEGTTTAIPVLTGVVSSSGAVADGTETVWDDSEAELSSDFSGLTKQVLARGIDPSSATPGDWYDVAPEPFALGDSVYYKVRIRGAENIETRDALLIDHLPVGVDYVSSAPMLTESVLPGVDPGDVADYMPSAPSQNGNVLTWPLGAQDSPPSTSRFLPRNSIVVYLVEGVVAGQSASALVVDSPQNHAKYQQRNTAGELYFLRDTAAIDLDWGAGLVKGIRDIDGVPAAGNAFNSDVDGAQVVQGDEVRFRLDFTGPQVGTTDIVIWDALPSGIRREHIKDADPATGVIAPVSAPAATVTGAASTEAALPAGTWTATVYDYDAVLGNYPAAFAGRDDVRASVKSAQRSIIVWEVSASVPGSSADPAIDQGLTLGYTVVVPWGTPGTGVPGALLEQRYVNDASIVEYGTENNGGGTTTVVPTGPNTLSTAPAGPGEVSIPETGTFDPSDIELPAADMTKARVTTEIPSTTPSITDPNNPESVIVQGEYVTYDVSVVVPANTSVREGVLADLGNFVGQSGNGTMTPNTAQFQIRSATVTGPAGITVVDTTGSDPAVHPSDFGFRTDTGRLVFPEYYTTGAAPETFTVRLVVWTRDVDESNPTSSATRPSIPNGKVLRNTATFDSKDVDGDPNTQLVRTADVTYREPLPTLAKTVVGGTVGADGIVTFRLTAGNTTGRPALYDAVVYDCLPAEFTLVSLPAAATEVVGGCTVAGTGANVRVTPGGGSGTLIEWQVGRIDAGTPHTLEFDARVTGTAGGGVTYTNRAHIIGQTLPDTVSDPDPRRGDRATGASRDITLANATLAKSVTPTSAPVGDTVEYTLEVTLPPNANFYDVALVDTLPTGLSYAGNPTIDFDGFLTDPDMSATPSISGQELTWVVDSPGDILLHTAARTITITFDATVTDGVVATAPRNTGVFSWSTIDGGTTRLSTPPATADVTILDPVLQIVKLVDTEDSIVRNPDVTFDYTLEVSQTAAGSTPAHHITVQDVVPAGVKVDTTQTALDDATFSDASALTNGLGGTITWQLDGPLDVQGGPGVTSITLGYEASFVDSIDLASTDFPYENVANVTHFESFGTDGRDYDPPLTGTGSIRDTADVTPLFPDVVPTKTVTTPVAGETYGVAEAGEPFSWTLTIDNEGLGIAEDVSVTDLLPKNWEYDGNAMISIDGATAVSLADPALTPATVSEGDQQELVWSEAVIRAAGGAPLAAGTAFVITFDAIPTDWALTDAGTGIIGNGVKVNPHVNTLSVTATDTTGADENGDGDYVGDDSTATAYIAEMDLLLSKDGIGGVTDSAAFDGLAVDTWIAGQGVVPGYAQPQWQITVTNQGPDDGFGPFAVVDTMDTLPTGVSVGTWSARYFSGPGDTTGTDLGTFPAGSGTFALGTTATSLQADGSDRIVLTADVTIDADAYTEALPGTLSLANEASVSGRTYEDPTNLPDNEDDDTKDVTELADLSITKVVTDPVPPTAPVVDSDITWQITVTNLGPSVSRSTGVDPITITDTVPAGVTDVTASTNGDWVPTVTRGGAPSTFPAEAGDVVTWTYQGAEMPVAATAAVSLTGTILASHTGDLINSATVHPTETPDPVDPNNDSEVPVTPDDSTTMRIDKTRVVDDGAGGWRQADPATDPDDAFVAGEPVNYLITVTNDGPADARDVTVVDEVPAGLTYDTHTDVVGTWTYASGGTTSTGTDTSWNTFTLGTTQAVGAANATSFVITYDTETTLTGDVENWAEVTIDNWDPTDPGGPYDRDDDDTGSTRIVDLGIVKSHTGAGPFTPGTEVEYTLVVTNHGPSATNGEIEIADSLPVGMSYVAGSAAVVVPAGTTAPTDPEPTLSGTDNRVLTWELLDAADTFDLSETITVTFRALIDPSLREAVSLVNDAEVGGPDTEPSPDPNPNEDDDTIVTGGTDADMTIVKTVAGTTWLAGETATYTLTITNLGPSAVPASVTDTLPTGLTMVSMAGTNWDCSAVVVGAGSGTCDYLDGADTNPVTQVLHPVGVSTITVVAAIAPTIPTGTALDNEAVLTWTDGDGSHTEDDDVPITVTTDADLGIVKDVITGAAGTVVPDPAPATAGETAWYRLQVTNHGPSDAVGPITVVDELPLGVTVPSTLTAVGPWTVVPGAVTPGVRQIVTLTLVGGQLANTAADATRGVAPVIEFEVDLDPSIVDGATLTNDADVSSPTPDSNPANDEDTAVITSSRLVDLGIVKSHPVDANGQVVIDQPLDFTIQVTNHGPSEASGVEIVDTVPVGLEVTSVVGPVAGTGWTIDSIVLVDPLDVEAGAVVTATYAPVLGVSAPTNAADPLVISTIVRESARGTAPNHVEVTANEPEPTPDPNPNETDDPLDVLPRVTLVVTKTAVGTFQVGKRGTYEITVENLGPHDDPGPLEVEDVLPAGLTYYASPHAGVAVTGQTVTWTIPGLAVGDTETITLLVDIHQAAYPSVTNVATVTTPSELTPPSDPDDDDTVTVDEADPIALTGLDTPVFAFGIGALLLLVGTAIVAATTRRRWTHRID